MASTTISYLDNGIQRSIMIPCVLSARETERLQEYFQNTPSGAQKLFRNLTQAQPINTDLQSHASQKYVDGPYAGLSCAEATFLEEMGWRWMWAEDERARTAEGDTLKQDEDDVLKELEWLEETTDNTLTQEEVEFLIELGWFELVVGRSSEEVRVCGSTHLMWRTTRCACPGSGVIMSGAVGDRRPKARPEALALTGAVAQTSLLSPLPEMRAVRSLLPAPLWEELFDNFDPLMRTEMVASSPPVSQEMVEIRSSASEWVGERLSASCPSMTTTVVASLPPSPPERIQGRSSMARWLRMFLFKKTKNEGFLQQYTANSQW